MQGQVEVINIERMRGDTYSEQFEFTGLGSLIGASFLLTVDPEMEPADATANLFQLVGTVLSASLVEFPITALQADNVGTYYYDIQMTSVTGQVRTVTRGTWTFRQDITK